MSQYEPPITLTPELRLRRINRLQTIQGSLAIEGNSLSIEQITAVIQAMCFPYWVLY